MGRDGATTEHLADGMEQAEGQDAGSPGRPRRRSFLAVTAAGAMAAGCRSLTARAPGTESTPSSPTADGERTRAGDPDWRIRSRGTPEAVQGYTDKVSVEPGERFGLYVSTTAPGFRVSAYRVGWYGGHQARLVWRSDRVAGSVQARPRLLGATRTVRADWNRTLGVRADGWPEGAYLLRLDADNGHQRYVPLIVRSTSGAGRTVLMHAAATWQAYNAWGGYSLYHGEDGAYATRSLAVSFDRPYDADGAEKFMVYERAAVVLAERLGIPLAYTTGMDVHREPGVLHGAAAVLALGHDEYWTPQQREHVTRARDSGSNLAFLGANTCFRRIRLERGPTGEARTVVCYKSDYRKDPYFADHPDLPTHDFRDPPGADPESSLTGVLYEGYPVDAPYAVHAADHWVFEGTGVRRGDSFDHLVGVEYDRVTPEKPTPPRLEVIAHSPLVWNGKASHADSAYYTVPSGSGVFATGTMRWVEALMAGTRDNGRNHGMDARTGRFVTRSTENLLRAFAAGPAGRTKPQPRDNVAELYPSSAH
ncbi:N,N-dimethylformamidase beta subunit family domain-containing protein [Streptomyces sp. NPDC052052]|uniref:N,N-dimethylformamidase beta subunit family domain-containing protein n=1 Tax=Streptomyces sp. NPDC052052 TaxID=3154756 RepID=UPI00341E5194